MLIKAIDGSSIGSEMAGCDGSALICVCLSVCVCVESGEDNDETHSIVLTLGCLATTGSGLRSCSFS